MDTVIDPVCGREIDRDQAAAQIITDGRDFHFRSQNCFDLFQDSLEDYVDLTPVDPDHPDERTYDEGIERDAADQGSAGRIIHPAPQRPGCLLLQPSRAFHSPSVTDSVTLAGKLSSMTPS
jgi:YHS domain-containing protein